MLDVRVAQKGQNNPYLSQYIKRKGRKWIVIPKVWFQLCNVEIKVDKRKDPIHNVGGMHTIPMAMNAIIHQRKELLGWGKPVFFNFFLNSGCLRSSISVSVARVTLISRLSAVKTWAELSIEFRVNNALPTKVPSAATLPIVPIVDNLTWLAAI